MLLHQLITFLPVNRQILLALTAAPVVQNFYNFCLLLVIKVVDRPDRVVKPPPFFWLGFNEVAAVDVQATDYFFIGSGISDIVFQLFCHIALLQDPLQFILVGFYLLQRFGVR